MIRIISLFSGCGGLDLGFEQVGDYKTVWANDFKHEACETFRNHFGDVILEGDIEQVDPYTNQDIPECDIILGGFPCQDFSIIWKRPGLDGERGNLYKSFLRFVDAKKPKAFVAENVKGILTANKRKAIRQIIEDFQNIAPGYVVIPHLYNFAEYGVPEYRERVLMSVFVPILDLILSIRSLPTVRQAVYSLSLLLATHLKASRKFLSIMNNFVSPNEQRQLSA